MSIYMATNMQPNGNALDMSLAQTFFCILGGSQITDYQIRIYKVSDNTILYDSTKINLTIPLFDKDVLNVIIPSNSITYTGSVYWTIQTYNGTSSATSRQIQFYSATTPSVSLSVTSPITQKSVTITTTYTQSQSVPVQSYQYFLWDSAGIKILDQSPIIYSAKLSYTFDGFISGNSYKVQCIVTNSYGIISNTGLVSFNVSYAIPSITITPTVTQLNSLGAVSISWINGTQIGGTATGSTNYVSNYLNSGNMGLQLNNSSSNVSWNVSVPATFTEIFIWNPSGFTSGLISSFDGVYNLSYDGAKFVSTLNNGTNINSSNITLNNSPYLIAIRQQDAVIIQNNTIVASCKPWWVS